MSETLRGQLLVAAPILHDPNFHRTVIFVAEHSDEGAMGLVLNRPTDTQVDEALPDLSTLAGDGEPVYVGGPVALDSVLAIAELDDPEDASELLLGNVGFVQEADAPVLRGRVFVGYAGWSAGQLEEEVEEESWLVLPAEADDLFSDDPDGLWSAVLRRQGGPYALLSSIPPDPSRN
ncbi:MAG: YqgE/AlgH family protein [Actinomycetota bacterium]|nr:YqgE/AlgH family protein [Actinomycetota bacterium]